MIVVRGCEFPDDCYYHVEHNVWLQGREAGVVTLGATSFGVALAVRVSRIHAQADWQSPSRPTGAVGLLELWKTMISVRTPVAGKIVAVQRRRP